MDVSISKSRTLRGTVTMPSDKSISHRAAILGAVSYEGAEISNYLRGRDTDDTLNALRALGVRVEASGSDVLIGGRPEGGLREPEDVLWAGTSATTVRFLAGLLASQDILAVITGAPSLRRRPMARIIDPLTTMGASVQSRQGGLAPIIMRGGRLSAIDHHVDPPSSEVKTCLMLAALEAHGVTTLTADLPTRDHTERMLRQMGGDVAVDDGGKRITVRGGRQLSRLKMRVPGEISAAVYWLAGAAVHPDADVVIEDVGNNAARTGVIDALLKMGADIECIAETDDGLETTATYRVRSSQLHGVEIGPDITVRMLDEVPGFVLAAALAEGETVISGAGDLRSKKSNRLTAVVQEFQKLGADLHETADGLSIRGVSQLTGGVCDSHGDHRLASALAMAGTVATGETVVTDADPVAVTSYPHYWDDISRITGAQITTR